MEIVSSEWTQLLSCLSQPVFLVRNSLVDYANPAAASVSVVAGISVYALLGDSGAQYRAFDGAGSLSLPLSLGAVQFRALIHRVDRWDLFALSEQTHEPVPIRFDAFSSIAQALRLPVSNLFATASNFFPRLEQYEDHRLQSQMAVLNKSFYQLLRAIGNLSDAGGLMTGSTLMRMEQVELLGWYRDLADRLAPLCAAVGISFTSDCPAGSLLARIDPARLSRAVLNLFSNALKHTEPGGSIHMALEHTDTTATIQMIDTGDGMDSSALSEAFLRYADPDGFDPRGGIGLGLPIARWIAMQHGGTIMIYSQPNQGTTAALSFSIAHNDAAALRTPSVSLGGFDPLLVELSDALPSAIYDSENVN